MFNKCRFLFLGTFQIEIRMYFYAYPHKNTKSNTNQKKMASIDMSGMSNSISIELALSYRRAFLVKNSFKASEIDDILNLFSLCITFNIFEFEDKFYYKKEILLWVVLYLLFWPTSSLLSKPELRFFLRRYVDDELLIYNSETKLDFLLKGLNSFHPTLPFPHEFEKDGRLIHLDLLIFRKNNKFQTVVYKKPLVSMVYTHQHSGR